MNSKAYMLLVVFFVLSLFLVACGGSEETQGGNSDAQEDSEEPFYDSSDVIEIIIPFPSGGGTDVAVRYIAPFFPDHIEGSPSLQVVNVPGGGSVIGANEFAMSDTDGYNAFNTSASVPMQYLLRNPDLMLDFANLVPLMAMPASGVVSIKADTGYTEPKDLLELEEELYWGGTDPSGADVRYILAFEALEVIDNVDIVFGYEGSGDTRVAYEQGEINIDSQTTAAYLEHIVPMEERGESIPMYQQGILDEDGNLQRDPAIPDVMTVEEFYIELYGEEPDSQLYEAYKMFGGMVNAMQKVMYFQEGTPQEAIDAVREGMESLVQDEEFIDGAYDAIGTAPEDIIVGDELDGLQAQFANIDDDLIEFVRNLFIEKYGADLD